MLCDRCSLAACKHPCLAQLDPNQQRLDIFNNYYLEISKYVNLCVCVTDFSPVDSRVFLLERELIVHGIYGHLTVTG